MNSSTKSEESFDKFKDVPKGDNTAVAPAKVVPKAEPATPAQPVMRKVRYIGSKTGCRLFAPLSDGRVQFKGFEVYEVAYQDFVRLVQSKNWEEVLPETK